MTSSESTRFTIPDPRFSRWAWIVSSLWHYVEIIQGRGDETSLGESDRPSLAKEADAWVLGELESSGTDPAQSEVPATFRKWFGGLLDVLEREIPPTQTPGNGGSARMVIRSALLKMEDTAEGSALKSSFLGDFPLGEVFQKLELDRKPDTAPPAIGTRGFLRLVRKAQGGDRSAMDEVLGTLRPDIRLLASRFADPTRRLGSTSDLLQDACLRAWLKLDSFEGGKDDEETFAMFQAWIGTLIRRLGINAERDRKRQRRSPGEGRVHVTIGTPEPGAGPREGKPVDPISDDPTPSVFARGKEAETKVREALSKVSDRVGAELVKRRFYVGQSIRVAAEEMDLDYDQAYTRYRNALKELEKHLGGMQ